MAFFFSLSLHSGLKYEKKMISNGLKAKDHSGDGNVKQKCGISNTGTLQKLMVSLIPWGTAETATEQCCLNKELTLRQPLQAPGEKALLVFPALQLISWVTWGKVLRVVKLLSFTF